MEVKIRPATTADAHDVLEVYVESWNKGFGKRMPVISAEPTRLDRWRKELGATTPTHWWVGERLGAIVGFVGIGPCRDPHDTSLGELDTIAVRPSAWRTGVGRQLMAVALEALRFEGYELAVLWTLNEYERGESFYLECGWRCTGKLRQSGSQVRYDYRLR